MQPSKEQLHLKKIFANIMEICKNKVKGQESPGGFWKETMKHRTTQLGVRKNPDSPRVHGLRFAANLSSMQSQETVENSPGNETSSRVAPLVERPRNPLLIPLREERTAGSVSGSCRPVTNLEKGNEGPGVERPITCKEASQVLGIHPRTIKRMARGGKVPGHFRFGRWYFYATELDSWMRTDLNSVSHP